MLTTLTPRQCAQNAPITADMSMNKTL
jgi:hypothetical protein